MAFKHKFKYQDPVKYKDKLAYVESLILNDFVQYQVRMAHSSDIYGCTEKELAPVDKGDQLLYGE